MLPRTIERMRLLPLANLRTFEVAARHMSFGRAAAELNLTDSAISHQIRKLEDVLGFELFEKHGRRVQLTPAGVSFAKTVRTSLQSIYGSALRLAEPMDLSGTLHIACPPMFASGWLSRNISDFCETYPQIECHIQLSENGVIPEANAWELGIVFGSGNWPNLQSHLLEDISIGPVCSPALLGKSGTGLRSPLDLRNVVLLHWDDGSEWRRWLHRVGMTDTALFHRNLFCSDLSMAINMALNGAGCSLASETLTGRNLKEGSLVRPFSETINSNGGWYMITKNASTTIPRVRAFADWMLGKFGRTPS